jgi:hypothetical protein
MTKKETNGSDDLGVDEEPDIDIVKVTNTTATSQTIFFALVDEAMWAHRSKDFINMFDCVNALWWLLKSIPCGNDRHDMLGKRFISLVKSVDVNDCCGVVVKIPVYNLMRAAYEYYGITGKYVIDIVDCDGCKIHMYIHDVCAANDYIGRILLISLFEMMQIKDLYLPEELYTVRNKTNIIQ